MKIENQEKINMLKQKVSELEIKRMDLLMKRKTCSKEEFSEYIPKINSLLDEINVLHYELSLLRGPDFTNGVIDIYSDEDNDEIESIYFITIYGSQEKIGRIRVTWKNIEPQYGNIGYSLKENYKGNHYTLQALELLKDTMINKGLTKPIFTAKPDNIPSIKTIENYGGKLIEEATEEQNYNTYEVDLLENNVSRKH